VLKFTCSLPVEGTGPDGFQSIDAIGRAAQAIEAAGADACYATDHPAPSKDWLAQPQNGAHETLDSLVVLTIAAGATKRIKLHTNILVLPYRNPLLVAKTAATLDALTGGRLILGVGVGYHAPEFAALGVPFEDRGAILDEGIKVLRMAWTAEPISYKGRSFDAQDVVVGPRPAQPGGIPIWIGGNSKRAVRRAVELGDGWSPFPAPAKVTDFAGTGEMSSIEHLREKLAYMRDLCAEMGRTKPLDVSTGWFGGSGQLNHGGRIDPARAIDDYCALAQAGVTWASFSVPTPGFAAFLDNVQWFGEEVIAKVRKLT